MGFARCSFIWDRARRLWQRISRVCRGGGLCLVTSVRFVDCACRLVSFVGVAYFVTLGKNIYPTRQHGCLSSSTTFGLSVPGRCPTLALSWPTQPTPQSASTGLNIILDTTGLERIDSYGTLRQMYRLWILRRKGKRLPIVAYRLDWMLHWYRWGTGLELHGWNRVLTGFL